MKLKQDFIYLKKELRKMKKDEEERVYMILHMLDTDKNAVKFFIFNQDLITKIDNLDVADMQVLTLDLSLVFNQTWRLNVVDVHE